jgi:hypothetical protein
MNMSEVRKLPSGWIWSDEAKLAALRAEYQRELPDIHPLHGITVEAIAHRDGNDDILVRHAAHDDRVSVVHLTWCGHTEIANHPRVEFTGTHDEFLEWELITYGVGPAP